MDMSTLSAWIVVFVILTAGLIVFALSMKLARKTLRKDAAAKSLLKGFREKIWMTIGLGAIFFGLYLAFIAFMSKMNSLNFRKSLFLTAYQDPLDLIYLGLFVFALGSFTIYLVRLAIIYLYNTWYKK